MNKSILLVAFLCCHLLHLSCASADVGGKVASAVVHTGILGSIQKAATHAAATVTRPIWKFVAEGGTGLVTRYFTLNDYFGIGQTIQKGAVKTATSVGKTAWSVGSTVGSVVKKFAKKRMQEQAEEINRWWTRQKLETLNSIKSGIAGGIGAGVASSVVDKIVGNNNDDSSSSDGDNFDGSGTGGGDSGESTSAPETTQTTLSSSPTTTESNPFGVSISDPFYAKPWGIKGSGGSISSSSVFNIFGKPTKTEDSSVSTSQVVIGKPVGEQTGEADTSSTVVQVKDPFKSMFGTSEDESSESGASGGSFSSSSSSDSGSGCDRRCRKEKARSRKNSRRGRSVDSSAVDSSAIESSAVDPLEAAFENIAHEDPQQCLPLLFCAIHADPLGRLTPQETKLVQVFRPLVIHRHTPGWAAPWVQGARQRVSVSYGKHHHKGDITCRKAFPNCPFSAHYLRSLMAKTYGAETQNDRVRSDAHLELNMIES